MRGSSIAAEIVHDWKREKYFKRKSTREQCKDKECDKCKHIDICEDYKETMK